VGESVHIVDTLYTSNIKSTEYINIDANQVNIKGVSLSDGKFEIQSSNISFGSNLIINRETGYTEFHSDVLITGSFECGSLVIQPFQERTRILEMAKSNLQDFFVAENGLLTDGAVLTPEETVFTKPVYFLDEIYLSSNLKIDPIFNISVQCRSNITIDGGVYGNENNPYGLMIKDNTTFYEPITIQSNMQINDMTIFYDTNSNGYWRVFTHTLENLTCDLIFQSRNRVATAFTDEFNPSIINFTGQHRCTGKFTKTTKQDLIGKIVVSTGEYSDLLNKKIITINEAIPIVKLCSKSEDARVFGIISDEETNDMIREFHLGSLKFSQKKKIKNKKYMINAVGEGGIWITNINGNLKNGDYITTSSITGYGMRQHDDIHRNYTVAKITCDCDFDMNSKVYTCEELIYKNTKYLKAFVGCVYKC
jgi:hypothetical protein